MRRVVLIAALAVISVACTRKEPSASEDRKSADRTDNAAREAGRAAHRVADDAGKAARKAGQELRDAAREAREGWNEESRDKARRQAERDHRDRDQSK